MSDSASPTILDWIFRGLAAVGPVCGIAFGYVLNLNRKRSDDFERRLIAAEGLVQENRLAVVNGELALTKLHLEITENFTNKVDMNASLQRVHEKIEDGNKKTDELSETVVNKIDQLRRDLQADIRSAIATNRT